MCKSSAEKKGKREKKKRLTHAGQIAVSGLGVSQAAEAAEVAEAAASSRMGAAESSIVSCNIFTSRTKLLLSFPPAQTKR